MFDNARTAHLSDEAVAAYADGVLTGHPRERARRHVAECAECAYAVAVQREAVWALRSSPAPSLPTGLFDRLREVPLTTPITAPLTGPAGPAPDAESNGLPFLFGAAALVPPALVPPAKATAASSADAQRHRRARALAITAASAVAVSAVAGTAVFAATDHPSAPPAHVQSDTSGHATQPGVVSLLRR